MTEIYKLASAVVAHGEDTTVTTFASGRQLVGDHKVQPGQSDTADQYNMSVEVMNRYHDLTHSVLAAVLGLPASPSLENTAHGRKHPDWWIEERAVLALQAYAAAFGVDMATVAQRVAKMGEH